MAKSKAPGNNPGTSAETQENLQATSNVVDIRQATKKVTSVKDSPDGHFDKYSDERYIAHLENKDEDPNKRMNAARKLRYYKSAKSRRRIVQLLLQVVEDETEHGTLVRYACDTLNHLAKQEQEKGSYEAPGKGLSFDEIGTKIDEDELDQKISYLEDKKCHPAPRKMAAMELLAHKMTKLPDKLEAILFRIYTDEDEDIELRGYVAGILACFPEARGSEEIMDTLIKGNEKTELEKAISMGFGWQSGLLGGLRTPKSKEFTKVFADQSQTNDRRLNMTLCMAYLLLTPEEVQHVWEILNDRNEAQEIRNEAIRILVDQKDQRILDRLRCALNESEEPEIRREIAWQLVLQMSCEAHDSDSILVNLLLDETQSEEMRKEACGILERDKQKSLVTLDAIKRFKWRKD